VKAVLNSWAEVSSAGIGMESSLLASVALNTSQSTSR